MKNNGEGSLKLPSFLSYINPPKDTAELLNILKLELSSREEKIRKLIKYRARLKSQRSDARLMYGNRIKNTKKYKLSGRKLTKATRDAQILAGEIFDLRNLTKGVGKRAVKYKSTQRDMDRITHNNELFGFRTVTFKFYDPETYIKPVFSKFIKAILKLREKKKRFDFDSDFRFILGLKINIDFRGKGNEKKLDLTVQRLRNEGDRRKPSELKMLLKKKILKAIESTDGITYMSTVYATPMFLLHDLLFTGLNKLLLSYLLVEANVKIDHIKLVERKSLV
jgi:hypothetical protein